MRTKFLILILMSINTLFTFANAQLTQKYVKEIDKKLAINEGFYPDNVNLAKDQVYCVMHPSNSEDSQDLIVEKYYVKAAKSLHVKNRYTRREFKNIQIRVRLDRAITNDDVFDASVPWAWTIVVPIGMFIAKGFSDYDAEDRATSEVLRVFQNILSNPNNFCSNLENNGDLNLQDLPKD